MTHGRACKQYVCRSCNTPSVKAMRFDDNLSTCQCEKEDKKAERFQISHLYSSFSSVFMAVKDSPTGPWMHVLLCLEIQLADGIKKQFG